MKETSALIESIAEAAPGYQRLTLAFETPLGRIKPGQTLLVQTSETMHPYLREHWWPVNIKGDYIIVERPIRERYEVGQVVSVLGFVGQPYKFRRNLRNVLLIAYNTPPIPLLMTIPWLLGNNISVTLVLAGTARDYSTRLLDARVEIITGDDDFTWPNQVMNVGWADQVFVAVDENDELALFRKVLERFEALRAIVPASYLFGIFRPVLPCGAGACQACLVSLKSGEVLACTEGPAFDLTQMVK